MSLLDHPSSPTASRERDRVAGGLEGLLIGDALGVPFEFKQPGALPAPEQIDFEPPASFPRSHAGTPPGTWSDDGAQALCLLASLLYAKRLDLDDFSRRLVDWADRGYLAVDGRVFDIGIQTNRAIAALRGGASWETSGPAHEMANGNGALMRVLPLALWHRGPDAELIALAAEQSRPTHAHPRSRVCCAMLCLWAKRLLESVDAPWDAAARVLRDDATGRDATWRAEVDGILDPGHARSASGSGYVVDTLWSARLALQQGENYAAVVRRAIAFGHDTDTTAAIAGGLAGIRHGLSGIPTSWRAHLRGREILEPILRQLLEALTSG